MLQQMISSTGGRAEHGVRCRDALAAKTTEHAEREAAKATLEAELANAQSSVEELAADKERLESSLAATKASLQACERKLVSAEVHTSALISLLSQAKYCGADSF